MKNVVITGSTKGIGFAMANEFLIAGCNVTLSGRGSTLLDETKAKLSGFKDNYIYIPCNVQSKEDIKNLWDTSRQKWGNIDIWINNAGQNTPNEFVWNTEKGYTDSVINTNLLGMIYGSQIAANNMIKQKSGAIYSMEGLGSNDMIIAKSVLYGTTKRALTYFMRGLAKELEGTGVIAGRLSPGMMLTDFITKSPDGKAAVINQDPNFQKIFNILADRPETVAKFFIPRMLTNTRNDAHIAWLTTAKSTIRFMSAPFRKRKLV